MQCLYTDLKMNPFSGFNWLQYKGHVYVHVLSTLKKMLIILKGTYPLLSGFLFLKLAGYFLILEKNHGFFDDGFEKKLTKTRDAPANINHALLSNFVAGFDIFSSFFETFKK